MQAINDPATLCLKYIHQTNRTIFLTGKAGTGKTTLLKRIIDEAHKQTMVIAPTGIAALNAGGATIHSTFYLPFATFLPDYSHNVQLRGDVKIETRDTLVKHFVFNKNKKKLFQNLELLIIDEVSMLRADVLDAIDWALRTTRKVNIPFGGVQVVFIGDLLQLPPVYKSEEWYYLKNYYHGIHFFNAHALQQDPPIYIELEKIYRQNDEKFIGILNELRNNRLNQEHITFLNTFVKPDYQPQADENYITLTTHNALADTMNNKSLEVLKTKELSYQAHVKGNFPKNIFPVDENLVLKLGAQVMFIKNDLSFEKRFFNGKIGVIDSLAPDEITVRFPQENKVIKVDRYEWENVTYELDENTNEIKENVIGTFVHYPLKLAWAITIHKSQGLTFDKAILDVSQVFAPGQAYVALSRLRSLDGLILKTPFKLNGLQNDQAVTAYATTKASIDDLNKQLSFSTLNYLKLLLVQTFDWNELEEIWRKHHASYAKSGAKSEKMKHYKWAEIQFTNVKSMVDVAGKFVSQISKIFQKPDVDVNFVNERLEKAYDHFYNDLHQLVYNVVKKRVELMKIKKVKDYLDEIIEVDDKQLEIMLRLKRVKSVFKTIVDGNELTKFTVSEQDLVDYRKNIIVQIQEELKNTKTTFDFDQADEEMIDAAQELLTGPKKEKEKKEKIPTHEVTLQLFKAGKTMEEIAQERLFTLDTIQSHITKLIGLGSIQIEEVFAKEKLELLTKLFDKVDEMTVTQMKEIAGDVFTWEELRMYKTALTN